MPDPPAGPLSWYQTRGPELPASYDRRALWRRLAIDALACLAVAAACFSQASRETLFRADRDFYNRLLLGPPTLLALLLNIVALAAAGFFGVQMIRRAQRPRAQRLAAVATAAALLLALNFVRMTYDTLSDATGAVGRAVLLALAVLVLAAAFRWPRRALRESRRVALLASPLAILTLVPTLWMFLEVGVGPVVRRVDPAPLKTAAPSLRRVVWLVFEDLDQDVTFEARPPGLELPALDRLRRESVYADAARPPAGTTEVSMTALVTGRSVVAVAPVNANDLDLTFADGKTERWSAEPSVFSRARVQGYDTAVVGWHLPYGRVLGGALGAAEWRPSAADEQARGDTVSAALANQWKSLVPPLHLRRLSAERFSELGDLALRTAADGRFGLVLLHLPLPHPPGIYDRATGRLTSWNFRGEEAEYLENLVLADQFVGELRRRLEGARMLDRTWLVVSSARWWRAADHRVPFLVRSPEGGRRAHVDGPFNTLGTHDLVLAILRGSVDDMDAAVTWLTRYPSKPPRGYTNLGRPID